MGARRYGFGRRHLIVLFRVVDGAGSAVARLRTTRPPAEPRRILLVNLAHIGDVLLTTPAVAAIRERHPSAHVTMLVGPWSRDVVEGNPRLDQVLVHRASWWDRSRGSPYFDPPGFLELVRLERDGRFDAVVNFKSFFQENLASALAGIPMRVGYGLYGGGFLHTVEPGFPWDQHTAVEHLGLAAALGARPDPRSPEVFPSEDDRAWAATRLAGLRGEAIGMHVGAGVPARRWPLDRFRALADALHERRDATIVLVGGPDDRAAVAEFGRVVRAPTLPLAGEAGLRRTAAVLARCAAFVGNDSGPAHLAAAAGIPTVVVFSATNVAARWRPWGRRVTVLQEVPACAMCGLAICARADHACMTGIPVERVLTALETAIDRGGANAAAVDAPRSGS
jgi:heptosyltransferase-2